MSNVGAKLITIDQLSFRSNPEADLPCGTVLNTIALVLTWQNNVRPPDLPQCSFRLLGRA